MGFTILNMDVIEGLRSLKDSSVHVIVTSPPYWGLRQYAGVEPRQWDDGTSCVFGLEPTIDLYVQHSVEIFRELKRVLHPSGSFWLNLGDCYDHAGPQPSTGVHRANGVPLPETFKRRKTGRSKKNLAMVPARVAIALQQDGWLLRQDNIWVKGCSFLPAYSGSVMPESIQDRTVWAHEHLFHFALERYEGPEKVEMSRDDAIWLAAMVDAEGSIGIQRNAAGQGARVTDGFQVYVTTSNTSQAIVDRLKRLSPNHVVHEGAGTNKPIFALRVNSAHASKMLRTIRPFLVAKGLQADIALALQHSIASHTVQRSSTGTRLKRPDDLVAYQRRLWEAVKATNQGENVNLDWVEWEPLGRYKEPVYYYDIEGNKEPYAASTLRDVARGYQGIGRKDYGGNAVQDPSQVKKRTLAAVQAGTGRNLRNVWVVPKEPLKEAHFAAFPTKLVEPVIKLGSSEKGCCPTCLNPWERVTHKEEIPDHVKQQFEAARGRTELDLGRGDGYTHRKPNFRRKVLGEGWRATCDCLHGADVGPIPCTVLDPFCGSGRAGIVAVRQGRDFMGIDASPEYCSIARRVIEEEMVIHAQTA